MNTNETKNENTVQKPCSNTSKSGANVDKSRGSGKRMNMSPIIPDCDFLKCRDNIGLSPSFLIHKINPITINTRLNNCEISVAIAAPFIPIHGNPNFPNING